MRMFFVVDKYYVSFAYAVRKESDNIFVSNLHAFARIKKKKMEKEKIRQVGSINFSNCNSEPPSPTQDPPLATVSPSYRN